MDRITLQNIFLFITSFCSLCVLPFSYPLLSSVPSFFSQEVQIPYPPLIMKNPTHSRCLLNPKRCSLFKGNANQLDPYTFKAIGFITVIHKLVKFYLFEQCFTFVYILDNYSKPNLYLLPQFTFILANVQTNQFNDKFGRVICKPTNKCFFT